MLRPRGFAVLMSWSDGTHTLVCYHRNYHRTYRQIGQLRSYWGPTLADGRVVTVTRAEFRQHPEFCDDPFCLTP